MTPGFTPEQREAVGRYVRTIADQMGLRDWAFSLMYDPAANDALAMITPVYGRKVASIWFCRAFAELEIEVIRQSICHELVHTMVNPITTTLEEIGPRLLGDSAWLVLWKATKERVELATDQIADAIAPTLPLLDWSIRDEARAVTWKAEPEQPHEPDPLDA